MGHATMLAQQAVTSSAKKRVLDKIKNAREIGSAGSDAPVFRAVATKWWKKLCWNQWKVVAENYNGACNMARHNGISRDIALYVYHQWEATDWLNDLADIASYDDEELQALLYDCFGLKSIEDIQTELDWCAANKRFRVPVAPEPVEAADEFDDMEF